MLGKQLRDWRSAVGDRNGSITVVKVTMRIDLQRMMNGGVEIGNADWTVDHGFG